MHSLREGKRIGALVKGQARYVRVDVFNESGITHGFEIRLEDEDFFSLISSANNTYLLFGLCQYLYIIKKVESDTNVVSFPAGCGITVVRDT